MVKWTMTSVFLLIAASATLAALPVEAAVDVTATVTHFSGSAHGIGLGDEEAGVRIVGRFTIPATPFIFDCVATATLSKVIADAILLDDIVGVPFTLVVTQSSSTTCIFENVSPGGPTPPPFVRLYVRKVAPNTVNFRLEISQGTRDALGNPPCPAAPLEMSFLLDDLTGPPGNTILVEATPTWTCFGKGNRYLKTP